MSETQAPSLMKRKHEKSLSVEDQLNLFANSIRAEREKEKLKQDRLLIQRSSERLKSLVKPLPEQNHTCSVAYCSPVNEQYFIDRKVIPGPPIQPRVYLCKYGRIHVCDLQYKECIIISDMFTNCTCQISGLTYGTSASLPSFRHGPSKLSAQYVEEDEFSPPPPDPILTNIGEDEKGEEWEGEEFDMDSNGDYDDDEGFDNQEDDTNDPFMALTNNIKEFYVPNSNFVEKVVAKPKVNIVEKLQSAPKVEIKLANQATKAPSKFQLPVTQNNKSRFVTFAMNQNGKRSGGMQIVSKNKPSEGKRPHKRPRTSKKYSFLSEPNSISDHWKLECQNLLNRLFYSHLRAEVGQRQLNLCLATATKTLTNDIRYIREKRNQGQKLIVNHYKLFLNFYSCITVNYTQIAVAPKNPEFVQRTTDIILMQWNILINSPLCKNTGTGKLNFINHALAILYEMRKGGLVLRNEQIIPKCEYTRTYMPPIDLIEHFGYKKGHITSGLKLLLEAHQSIPQEEVNIL